MTKPDLSIIFAEFLGTYEADKKDLLWKELSSRFRTFWSDRIVSQTSSSISDEECDPIIRILDRSGKGNRKDSEAIARAMIPQGAWRRLFHEFRQNRNLASLVNAIFLEQEVEERAELIDELYKINEGKKNNLTGKSANAINCFLAAYDPMVNSSVISLGDRQSLMEFFGLNLEVDWDSHSVGKKIVFSNRALTEGLYSLGLKGSARTLSKFFYRTLKPFWKGMHTIHIGNKEVAVSVPMDQEIAESDEVPESEQRESIEIQALLCQIGNHMGMNIWLPRSDRKRVSKLWTPKEGSLLDNLPMNFAEPVLKRIEQIDVLWIRKNAVIRAFEVEHTTSIYSGLLRMADLFAIQPNMRLKFHIVAPLERQEKVMREIGRPVFSLFEGFSLSDTCTYLSYDSVRELAKQKHLERMSDLVLDDYAETGEPD